MPLSADRDVKHNLFLPPVVSPDKLLIAFEYAAQSRDPARIGNRYERRFKLQTVVAQPFDASLLRPRKCRRGRAEKSDNTVSLFHMIVNFGRNVRCQKNISRKNNTVFFV